MATNQMGNTQTIGTLNVNESLARKLSHRPTAASAKG